MENESKKEVWHLIDVTNDEGEVVYNIMVSANDEWFDSIKEKYPKSRVLTQEEVDEMLQEDDFEIEEDESYKNN